MDLVGNGILIAQDQLHLAMNVRPEQFEMDKFRHICILSGCDYLPSLPGIGLGKARKFITKSTDQNIHRVSYAKFNNRHFHSLTIRKT